MLNTIALQIILFVTHDKRMKKKQIGKQCCIASLTGRFIVASDQLTTASLFIKAVIYFLIVNITQCYNPFVSQSLI
jgi:hypothetical protein